MALLVTMVALTVPAKHDKPDVCRTKACEVRVAHRRARAKKRRAIRPHRPWLLKVRRCESGGNYATSTGNGFYGAYQFTLSTWRSAGGRGMPHLASRLEQDYRAVVWARMIGWRTHTTAGWPVCG